MKLVRMTALLAFFSLLLPLTALAKDNSKGTVDLYSNAQVAGTQLKSGNYKVEWTGNGPATQVKFIQHGKTVVTAPADVVQLKKSAANDQVVVSNATGTSVVQEIDFGGKTTALRFGQTATGQQTGQ